MTLNQFFLELKRRDLTLKIDNDIIKIEGESQRISEKIKTFLVDHQEAIVRHLAPDTAEDLIKAIRQSKEYDDLDLIVEEALKAFKED